MPTVRTNDAQKREEFKSRLAERTKAEPINPTPKPERVYILPHNYEELSDVQLLAALVRTPEWKYDRSTAEFVLSVLNGVTSQPEWVRFEVAPEIVETPTPVFPEKKSPRVDETRTKFQSSLEEKVQRVREKSVKGPAQSIIRTKQPVAVDTTQVENPAEAANRAKFKDSLSQRVQNVPVPSQNTVETYSLPDNFREMTEAELYFSLTLSTKSAEKARQIIETLVSAGDFKRPTPKKKTPVPREKKDLSELRLQAQRQADDEKRFRAEIVQQQQDGADKVVTGPEPLPLQKVHVPADFYKLSGVELFGFISAHNQLTHSEVGEVIRFLNGESSTAFELILGPAAHKPAENVPPAADEEKKVVKLLLPYNFRTLRTAERFTWLQKFAGLSQDEANDVIDIYNGGNGRTGTEFVLTVDDPPALKHIEDVLSPALTDTTPLNVTLSGDFSRMKRSLQWMTLCTQYDRTTAADIYNVIDGRPAPSGREVHVEFDFGTQELQVPEALEIVVPEGFSVLKPVEQYLFLTKTVRLPANIANDALGDLRANRTDRFAFTYSGTFTDAHEREPKEFNTVVEKAATPAIPPRLMTVQIPSYFRSLSTSDKYWILLKDKGLTRDEANDAVASFEGRETVGNTLFAFEIEE